MTSGDPNIDLSGKIKRPFVMISDELSNAFSGFSLRRLWSELEGGKGDQTPLQEHVVENPHSQQGAG